jgi:carboxypeptidase D
LKVCYQVSPLGGLTLTTTALAAMALDYFKNVFNLNETFMADIENRSNKCGYTEFINNAMKFPPTGKLPSAPNSSLPGCSVWDDMVAATYYVNPCFNFYHLTDFCPYLWDEMEFPSLAGGPNNYFNRSDVQAAIHAPPTDYSVCGEYRPLRPDLSVPSSLGPLPSVIERTNNTIIGHGWLDYLLFANGTLATI